MSPLLLYEHMLVGIALSRACFHLSFSVYIGSRVQVPRDSKPFPTRISGDSIGLRELVSVLGSRAVHAIIS